MSNKVVIYHGSENVIEHPTFGYGNQHNDYGLAFYTTENIELAKEWACSNDTDGYANKYTIDMDGLSILSLTNGEYNILNWLFILLENRKFSTNTGVAEEAKKYILENFAIEYKQYDVIKGYRADDSYFSFAKAFLNNNLSIRQLERAMVLGKLGEQIAVVSNKAFERIEYIDSTIAPKEIYLPKKLSRDTNAKKQFEKERNRGTILTEKYAIDIIREGWKNNDERLQRVILG